MKPFELPDTTKVECTSVNIRRELHGEEGVLAVDLGFLLTGPNTLLDLIEPGLREEYFHNTARKKGQKALLPDEPLPNLRRPKVNNEGVAWDKGGKSRGYRFKLDYGIQDALVDLTDAVMYGIKFDCLEGGTVHLHFGVQYNGDDLDQADVRHHLMEMLKDRDVHIRLLAPPELLKVAKGYRAGHKDTPLGAGDGNPGQGQLGDGTTNEGSEGGELDPASPEGAFIATGGPASVH